MQRFTDLKVWQRSHALVLDVHRLTRGLPAAERFGLLPQLRRAVLSVPTNVAEGSKRQTAADYARFLNIAQGSLAETEYLLMVARDLECFAPDRIATLLAETDEIARMLHGLRRRVEGSPTS